MAKEKRKENKKTSGKRALVKKEDKAIIKKMTVEEARDFLNRISHMDDDPKQIMEKLSEDLFPRIKAGQNDKKVITETTETAYKALMLYGLDTHYPLAETVGKRYRSLAIEFSRQLIKEYNCKTPSEKALAEVMVSAYIRILEHSQQLRTCTNIEYISTEKNGFYTMLSKELDRANRQFITALTTLKQLKTPSLEVNVKTKAAFVAQNQQLNINSPDKDGFNKDENIKSK